MSVSWKCLLCNVIAAVLVVITPANQYSMPASVPRQICRARFSHAGRIVLAQLSAECYRSRFPVSRHDRFASNSTKGKSCVSAPPFTSHVCSYK